MKTVHRTDYPICRGGGHLRRPDLSGVVVYQDNICKCATDINANPIHETVTLRTKIPTLIVGSC
jgi:hypothetical protein